MPRTRKPHNQNPRHRYVAMSQGVRPPETPCEEALRELLSELPTTMSEDAKTALPGVEAALISYENPRVRQLFDACLLTRASAEDLQDAFGVTIEETRAYAELFFDREVFGNDFHVIAYISSVQDDKERQFLEEAFSKGFSGIRAKYASDAGLGTEATLEQIFRADAQQYLRERGVPITHKSAKELRALQKSVVAAAQAISKVAPPKQELRDQETTFVIESGPLNPTLEELLSKGVVVAQ